MAPSAASLATATLCCAVALVAAAAPPAGQAGTGDSKAPDAEEIDRRGRAASEEALKSLSTHGTWLRRMVCAMRLERPDANGARERLIAFAFDPDPRVRSAAVLALARTGAPPLDKLASTEEDPRVVRTMLRCGWPVPAERVERGARTLAKSQDNSDRLLGVELVGALDAQGRSEKRLNEFAKDTLASPHRGHHRRARQPPGLEVALVARPKPRKHADRRRRADRPEAGCRAEPGGQAR